MSEVDEHEDFIWNEQPTQASAAPLGDEAGDKKWNGTAVKAPEPPSVELYSRKMRIYRMVYTKDDGILIVIVSALTFIRDRPR